jgi:hypothetical protein
MSVNLLPYMSRKHVGLSSNRSRFFDWTIDGPIDGTIDGPIDGPIDATIEKMPFLYLSFSLDLANQTKPSYI